MTGPTYLTDIITPIAPVDALLAGYVAGVLPGPAHVLMAAHLEMSPRSRTWARDLELVAADAMADGEPASLSRRDEMLAAILDDEAPVPRGAGPEPAVPAPARGGCPKAIRTFIGRDLSEVPWRPVLPGLREWRVAEEDGCAATLIRIRQGVPAPHHTHGGAEITLVLDGAFRDSTGHYRAGDIAFADDTVEHRPVADLGRDCICFAVTDAPLRLTGLFGRWLPPMSS